MFSADLRFDDGTTIEIYGSRAHIMAAITTLVKDGSKLVLAHISRRGAVGDSRRFVTVYNGQSDHGLSTSEIDSALVAAQPGTRGYV